MDFFSVIIPTLNEEQFLPKLLNDLKKQTSKNFEILIIDASSKDGTKEVAQSYNRSLPLTFYTVSQKNVSYSRNFGADKAKGRYLVFLDADSRIATGFTKNLQHIVERQKGLIFMPYLIPQERSSQAKMLFQLVNFFISILNTTNRPFSSSGSMICERSFYHLIGGFNEALFIAEDHDLIYRALQWGVRAKFMPSVKIKFSLRRMKKEGKLNLLYKYFLVTTHLLLKGNVKRKMFEYEMGGQMYSKLPVPKEAKQHTFEEFMNYIKKLFIHILRED